ncbi:mediator of RNA polymerase II transcription subunit 1 [Sarcoptes scabiei]|nr:mediator of RNA polymerase II transcription subunit 1 [Sarcoptes scabiei]
MEPEIFKTITIQSDGDFSSNIITNSGTHSSTSTSTSAPSSVSSTIIGSSMDFGQIPCNLPLLMNQANGVPIYSEQILRPFGGNVDQLLHHHHHHNHHSHHSHHNLNLGNPNDSIGKQSSSSLLTRCNDRDDDDDDDVDGSFRLSNLSSQSQLTFGGEGGGGGGGYLIDLDQSNAIKSDCLALAEDCPQILPQSNSFAEIDGCNAIDLMIESNPNYHHQQSQEDLGIFSNSFVSSSIDSSRFDHSTGGSVMIRRSFSMPNDYVSTNCATNLPTDLTELNEENEMKKFKYGMKISDDPYLTIATSNTATSSPSPTQQSIAMLMTPPLSPDSEEFSSITHTSSKLLDFKSEKYSQQPRLFYGCDTDQIESTFDGYSPHKESSSQQPQQSTLRRYTVVDGSNLQRKLSNRQTKNLTKLASRKSSNHKIESIKNASPSSSSSSSPSSSSSGMKSSSTTTMMKQSQKRSAHLSAEFRYRTKLNEKINRLRGLVSKHKHNLSKSAVLTRSIEMIVKLQKLTMHLHESNLRLQQRLSDSSANNKQNSNPLRININRIKILSDKFNYRDA